MQSIGIPYSKGSEGQPISYGQPDSMRIVRYSLRE